MPFIWCVQQEIIAAEIEMEKEHVRREMLVEAKILQEEKEARERELKVRRESVCVLVSLYTGAATMYLCVVCAAVMFHELCII
jgi:hypothetical protein